MTELDRMILAARQIGEVVGEDLFAWLIAYMDGVCLDHPELGSVGLPDEMALDLLTARVWRAVQDICDANGWHLKVFPKRRVSIQDAKRDICLPTDLPSAVAAIHKHWQESRNA